MEFRAAGYKSPPQPSPPEDPEEEREKTLNSFIVPYMLQKEGAFP